MNHIYLQHLTVLIILEMDQLFPDRVSDILNIKVIIVVNIFHYAIPDPQYKLSMFLRSIISSMDVLKIILQNSWHSVR